MKAIQTGNTYRIYDNSMLTYNTLPARAYVVSFDKNTGFFLEGYSDIDIKEKVYGVHETKVNKVLSAFHEFNRNLGVILSGDKGIGKSLFSKMLAQRAIEQGFPLIIVNTYHAGIADYLNSIEQEVVILFDEFDKTFKDHDYISPQTEMLTLFDGICQGKKLFVITCNEIHKLNEYLVNRPGRFHYHFSFCYPSDAEIADFMHDKLDYTAWGEIDKVISFSHKVNLNYDCLRAIAFELSHGLAFEEAIQDLNILKTENDYYDLLVFLQDGRVLREREIKLDIFNSEKVSYTFRPIEDTSSYYWVAKVTFTPSDAIFDYNRGGCVIDGHLIDYQLDSCITNPDKNDSEEMSLHNSYINSKVNYIQIKKINNTKQLHYAL